MNTLEKPILKNKRPRLALYFAYGANINKLSMAHRCPTAKSLGSFMLEGYELKYYNHATIEPNVDGVVPGALWLLTEQDQAALDAFEGYPYYYEKQWVSQGGKHFFIYYMIDSKYGYPSPGYIQNIREGYEQFDLPLQAIDVALMNAKLTYQQ